ncbi:hypothetical protein [Nocardia wallacei]|uniref:Uncharacterized protein n=1 Tax=Nocardia wallacei TaxID=480035 RepID=A0A7G1KEB3_9NOCA|nr:hypothetical protein [Nocardia wallacei]BCK52449.1 hypothetical protein NWFMUON74_02210 [Nocardia wallacei]
MSPGQTLLISQVEKWNPAALGTDATSFANLVTKGDEHLQSMLTTQDDLAESWKGAAADAAARRVTNEKTAGSHLMGTILGLKDTYTRYQTALTDARQQVIDKRNLIQGMGFEVADNGTVTANAKIQAVKAAGGRNPNNDADPGVVAGAILQIEHEAAQQQLAMVTALQHADNTATAAKTAIDAAKAEISRVSLLEAPSKTIRTLYPGLTHPDTAKPSELPPNWQLLGETMKLDQGIPITVTEPDGSTKTITPNPDGTLTVASSIQQPDGSTVTTASTDGKPPSTTVSTPRTDGSGIVDTTITGADGKQQRLQTLPQGNGRSITRTVNDDGSLGAKVSESYPGPNGGFITDVEGQNGAFDREWRRPDGFREIERYVAGTDGQPKLIEMTNSDGTRSLLNADGSIDTRLPGGGVAKTITHDGIILTKFPDDSLLTYDPSKNPDGSLKIEPWDVVRSWGSQQLSQGVDSAGDNWQQHPDASKIGIGSDGAGEAVKQYGKTMADGAAQAAQRSADSSARALSLIESGQPGAGRAMVDAMDHASDAASGASRAEALAKGAKIGGGGATALLNVYTNVHDVVYDHKGIYEAAGNATGGTVGGISGAAAGAWALGGIGTLTGPAAPAAVPILATIGAMGGGYLGGAGGAYVGDKAGTGVRELFE